MKNNDNSQASRPRFAPLVILSIVGVIALAIVATQYDLFGRWRLQSNVDDLVNNRNFEEAVNYLDKSPRGQTIDALMTALDDETGTPQGKVYALQLLSSFKEDRAVGRALDSNNLTTQRAAAYLRQGMRGQREQVGAIALAWLRDKNADDRHLAAMALRTTNWREAIPDFIEVVKTEGKNADSAPLVRHSLGALAVFKEKGLAEFVLPLAKDPGIDAQVRAEAFRLLTSLDDAPSDDLRALFIEIASDRTRDENLRHSALSQLGAKAIGNEATWKVLKDVLFDEDETNNIIQRSALRSLVRSYPLDRIPEVLLDRRVYTNPYFGVRSDVAAGLGNLKVRSRLALDVLTKLIGDEDNVDFADVVVRQAWIAWWQITGMVYGVEKGRESLFLTVPKKQADEALLRRFMLSFSWGNPQISKDQVRALDRFTLNEDDGKLRSTNASDYKQIKAKKREIAKQIQQTYEGKIDAIVIGWSVAPRKPVESKKPVEVKKPADQKTDEDG